MLSFEGPFIDNFQPADGSFAIETADVDIVYDETEIAMRLTFMDSHSDEVDNTVVDTFTVLVRNEPDYVCVGESAWYLVTTGANAYTSAEGFASPAEDTSQWWRRKIVDDEEAKIVQIKGCIHADEACVASPSSCE